MPKIPTWRLPTARFLIQCSPLYTSFDFTAFGTEGDLNASKALFITPVKPFESQIMKPTWKILGIYSAPESGLRNENTEINSHQKSDFFTFKSLLYHKFTSHT